MSHNENFKDSTNAGSILLFVLILALFALFPMLMGWFSILS